MKTGTFLFMALFIPVFLMTTPFFLPLDAAGSVEFGRCAEQCKGFTGSMKIKCIETCTRYGRKERGDSPNKRYGKCEKVCDSFRGIENVKCIRICLEKIKEMNKREGTGEKKTVDPCVSRCRIFNEPTRSGCMKRCRGKKGWGPPYRERSVW